MVIRDKFSFYFVMFLAFMIFTIDSVKSLFQLGSSFANLSKFCLSKPEFCF